MKRSTRHETGVGWPDWHVMPARFVGRCDVCGGTIAVGERMLYRSKTARHLACNTPTNRNQLNPARAS